MPAVDHNAEYAQWAMVLVLEGIPFAWSSHNDIVGHDYFGDGRTVLPGLLPPDYSMGIDPLADFQFKRTKTKIMVEDFGGELAHVLNNFDFSETEPLEHSVEPGADLATRPELHGMQLGPEAIGPAGERGQYPVVQGWNRALLHTGEDFEVSHAVVASVGEDPLILDGRRVMLYRIWRDVVTYPETMGYATWRPWSEAQRCWWGTLRRSGHKVDGRKWTLHCDGPESWVYKRLGHTTSDKPVKLIPVLGLSTVAGNDESRIYVRFTSKRRGNGFTDVYGLDDFASSIAGIDTLTIRASVSTAINGAAAAAGAAGVFEDVHGHNVRLDSDGLSIRVQAMDGADERHATVEVAMHSKAWKAIGFWPEAQRELALDDELFVNFEHLAGNAPSGTAPPGSGYWLGRFSTRALDSLDFIIGDDPDVNLDNNGSWRLWRPRYKGGTIVLSADTTMVQEILLDVDAAHHAGQFDRPTKSAPDDPSAPYFAGPNPRQGLWAIRGPRRATDEEEHEVETQVIQATWQEPALDLAAVAGDTPQIVVQRFEKPRALGIDRKAMESDWVAVQNDAENTLYATPLLRLGYGEVDGQDQAHTVLQRFLLSTGTTEGWTGFEGGGASQAATTNEPGGAGVRLDAEHIDLGASIPSEMVEPRAAWEEHADRLGSNNLRKMSLAVPPGMETEALLRGIMAPRGWGWSLHGGRYGLLDYSATTSPEGMVVLDWSTKATEAKGTTLRGHLTKQSTRAFQPKDEYVLEYAWNPLEDKFGGRAKMRSPDRGAPYRPKPIEETGEESRRHSVSTHTVKGYGMQNDRGWHERMAKVAGWADRGQFWLKGYKVTRDVGFDLWPGSRVLMSEPRAVGATGEYGITGARGIVTDVRFAKGGREVVLDILVDATPYSTVRYCAPGAQGRGYDPTTQRLYLYDNWLDAGGMPDATAFVEPSWSNLGGQAQIQVHQFDGHEWTLTCWGVVESMNDDPGNCYLVIAGDGLTGKYRRDDDALVTMRPMTQQDAPWVQALFVPICDEHGEWNNPPEKGLKWVP